MANSLPKEAWRNARIQGATIIVTVVGVCDDGRRGVQSKQLDLDKDYDHLELARLVFWLGQQLERQG